MYSKTQFGQLLEGFSRGSFEKLVSRQQADKYSKGFRCWDQYVAMLYAHVSGCKSLRELECSFNAQAAHHYHLGTRTIKRATLADANSKRSSGLFGRVCQQLIAGAHRTLKRELSELLYLMDSSAFVLQGLGFDEWAGPYRNHKKQGLKLHFMMEAHSATPRFVDITPMQVSDVKIGRRMPVETGATYVFDKGYYDYNWWHEIDQNDAKFVTRLKKNANISVLERYSTARQDTHIIEDAAIRFNNRHVKSGTEANRYFTTPVRRIKVKKPDKKDSLILVTNDFDSTGA